MTRVLTCLCGCQRWDCPDWLLLRCCFCGLVISVADLNTLGGLHKRDNAESALFQELKR